MALAYDDFTVGSDTNILSHTPTGTNAGTSWVAQVASPSINVIAATDLATENSVADGGRVRMSDDLGSDEMDIEADFTNSGAAGVFCGLLGRCSTSVGGNFVQFDYDNDLGRFNLADGASSANSAEAWPGGTVTLRLIIRNNDMKGYANGSLKCSITTNGHSGNNRAGITLGNFSGVSPGQVTADNYKSGPAGTLTGGGQPPRTMHHFRQLLGA